MQHLPDQIRQHPYPAALDHIAQEFGPQLDEVSCGPAAVHHGLLLGGLTIPKAALQAIFRTYPKPGPDAYGYLDPVRLKAGLEDLGLMPEWVELKSRRHAPIPGAARPENGGGRFRNRMYLSLGGVGRGGVALDHHRPMERRSHSGGRFRLGPPHVQLEAPGVQ